MVVRPQRIRHEPRISINSLAEYLTASPTRRASIVRDQKYPRGGIVARYTEAEDAIVAFLAAGGGDLAPILQAQRELEAKVSRTEKRGRLQMLQNANEALSSFTRRAATFALPGRVLELTADGLMKVGDVTVSVRPELAYVTEQNGRRRVGLVKLYFRKTVPVTQVMAQYIAAGTYQWGRNIAQLGQELALERCLVYDIFAGRVFRGPGSPVQRLADMEAACAEILLHWAVA